MIDRKDFLRLGGATMLLSVAGTAARATPTPKRTPRTLIKNADILTMEKGASDLLGADLLIEGDKIAAIGRGLEVADAEVVSIPGAILMPGMIDGHRHVWENLDPTGVLKTNQSYIDYQEWKMKTMPAMTAEDFYLAEYTGALEAIDSGVTTVLDYAHGLHTPDRADAGARGIKESGIAGLFCYQVSHRLSYGLNQRVPRAQADADRGAAPMEIHYKTARMLRDSHFSSSDGLMQFGLSLSNNSGRSMPLVIEEVQRVRALEPRLILNHNHVPSPLPPAGVFRSTAADLKAAGLLSPDHHISHGTNLTDEDLKMMADGGVKIAATPFVEFTYAPDETSIHARAKAAGMDVGIGLDAPLEFTKDYFEQIRAAWWSLYRTPASRRIVDTWKSEDLLSLVTREGARAAAVGDVTGTLQVGKRADLLLLRTERFGFPVTGSIADRIVNFASLADIDSVWIAGKLRKKDGRMAGVDWRSLKAKATAAQARIRRDAATVVFT